MGGSSTGEKSTEIEVFVSGSFYNRLNEFPVATSSCRIILFHMFIVKIMLPFALPG